MRAGAAHEGTARWRKRKDLSPSLLQPQLPHELGEAGVVLERVAHRVRSEVGKTPRILGVLPDGPAHGAVIRYLF